MNLQSPTSLSQCFSDLYQLGLTTSSGGNISSREKNGLICISPSQIDKGYLRPKDFSTLNMKGQVVHGKLPSMEFPFHLSVYRNFPKVENIIHIHSKIFVALSLLLPNDPVLTEVLKKFKIGYAHYGMPGSDQLGMNICEALKEGSQIIIMQNHGMLAVGKNLEPLYTSIISLNEALIQFLGLSEFMRKFRIHKKFDAKKEETITFYEKRIEHYIHMYGNVSIVQIKGDDILFYTFVKLKSLLLVSTDLFDLQLIPESYLILKTPLFLAKDYDPEKTAEYLLQLDTTKKILIFKDGWIGISAPTLYKLYDKLEVLDFTVKVGLMADKIGRKKSLTKEQIMELDQKFN